MEQAREYAAAGVDYRNLSPWKAAVRRLVPRTRQLPATRWDVEVSETGSFRYSGSGRHAWRLILESLGTKNLIAEWMYERTNNPRFFDGIGQDVLEMAVMDLLRQGAFPCVVNDFVALGDDAWCLDEARSHALIESFARACEMNGMAFTGGETPALRLLVRSSPNVPVLACAAVGLIAPAAREIVPVARAGAAIIGVESSGPHANGYSLLIRRGLALPRQFLTEVAPGRTFGEEALAPTRSYVGFIERVLKGSFRPLAVIPATGGGLGKLAADRTPFTYVIERWPENIPPIFPFLRAIGVSLEDCLSTFNWGIGLYLVVEERDIATIVTIGQATGCPVHHLGHVEDGEPKVVAHMPEGIVTIHPPGD